jgi:hypothetical protein
MADKNQRSIGSILWRVVMGIIAIWLVIWMLRMSGINLL